MGAFFEGVSQVRSGGGQGTRGRGRGVGRLPGWREWRGSVGRLWGGLVAAWMMVCVRQAAAEELSEQARRQRDHIGRKVRQGLGTGSGFIGDR